MIETPALAFALIGVLGVGAQWLAWRLNLPAIVLMLVAGLMAGPGLGLLNPEAQFGDLLRPIIAVAVALILFEGGLTLNFKELGGAAPSLRRLVFVGAPLGWAVFTALGYFIGGLSLPVAAVLGGILVITGPTVVTPLLRQARMASRPASILKWEAIVNDPVGALFAVFAFEIAVTASHAGGWGEALSHLAVGIVVASAVGWAAGWALVKVFQRGGAPEYMKAPILLAAVLAVYATTDQALHESGLLAVTVMGAVIGNARLPSLTELIRFKEHVTVLLVSGVFILLAASLDMSLVAALDWRAAAFVAAVIFIARPFVILTSLIGGALPWNERAILAWIAPRGVVAVAISGFFGARLQDIGYADGAALAPIAFALVAATVVLHGFSIAPVSRMLGLTSKEPPGVVIVGASPFAKALAEALIAAGRPVLIADNDWWALRGAREAGVPTWHGEILDEAFEHQIETSRYGRLVAATSNDALNALICTDFGPEYGRLNVHQLARREGGEDDPLPVDLGGRGMAGGETYERLNARLVAGQRMRSTTLSAEFGLEDYRAMRADALPIAVLRAAGGLDFPGPDATLKAGPGDIIVALAPDETEETP